ncbi:MAG: rhomboid family intramembrane serine protease [Thermoanaerobaculia bacterium]
MIPLKDVNPREKTPFVTYFLIIANVLTFLFEISLGRGLEVFFKEFGVIPLKFVHNFLNYPFDLYNYIPLFTSLFLHGGFLHLAGNMLSLWIFGDNVEDRMGHFFYLFFYFLSGIGASLAHIITNFSSPIPTIGASGAISGVMGAYFYFFPRARVLTLVPIFFFIQLVEIPAFIFLGLWFFLQLFSGALSFGGGSGGVAWWAHIGGFVFGYLIARIFFFKRKQRIIYYL